MNPSVIVCSFHCVYDKHFYIQVTYIPHQDIFLVQGYDRDDRDHKEMQFESSHEVHTYLARVVQEKWKKHAKGNVQVQKADQGVQEKKWKKHAKGNVQVQKVDKSSRFGNFVLCCNQKQLNFSNRYASSPVKSFYHLLQKMERLSFCHWCNKILKREQTWLNVCSDSCVRFLRAWIRS